MPGLKLIYVSKRGHFPQVKLMGLILRSGARTPLCKGSGIFTYLLIRSFTIFDHFKILACYNVTSFPQFIRYLDVNVDP